MRRVALLLALSGCGRIGFGSAPAADGAADGEADGIAPGVATFGEDTGARFRLVTRDTFISNETGESGVNYGGDDHLRLERDSDERGLLRFEVSALPPGTTVLSATLELTAIQVPPLGTAQIELRPLLEDWMEGGEAGGAGVANFAMRQAVIPWSLPGASPPASSDPVAASADVSALGRLSIPLPDVVVQDWIDKPERNHGLLLISQHDESVRFVTREGPDGDRPLLTVTYAP